MSLTVSGLVFLIASAPIARRCVKIAIAAESNCAGVVIEVRMIDFEEDLFVMVIRLAIFGLEFGEGPSVVPISRRRIFFGSGVNNEKTAVVLEIRMERKAD